MYLAAACRWAKKSGLIEMPNQFDGMATEIKVKKVGTSENEINPFTREERDRIIEAFENSKHYSHYADLVKILFFTVCRPSEAIVLQWKHISTQTITFNQAVIYDGKRSVLKAGLKLKNFENFLYSNFQNGS